MNNKKVIIVGAGMTGLAAGCYLQMNGCDTEIFELHSIPGGLCTGWKRKGYTFDGCIHWLCGSKPGSELHTIWEEIGLIKDTKIIDHDIFVHTDLESGDSFSVYSDPILLEAEMLRFAPEDEETIKEFINAIVTASKADMPVLKAQELYTLSDGLKMLFKYYPVLKLVRKWNNISIKDFQGKFKSSLFNKDFAKLFGMYEEMSVFAIIYTLALLANKDAGYPIGGSLKMARSVEIRYLELGGKINYNSKVEKIIVENNQAKGIRLSNNKEYYGDIVISAADGHFTIFDMLEGRFVDDEIEGYYKNYKTFPSILQVSYGIGREFVDIPDAVTSVFHLEEPVYIDPKNILEELSIKIYNYDETFAPKGKTAVVSFFEADYKYWVNLRKTDFEKYVSEKNRIALEIGDRLDKKLGNIKDNIEVFDVATPYTYEKYTNNWKGSFEGFIPTVGKGGKKLKTTLPGLDNFYMIGQWVQPGGGIPTSGMMGRHIAQIICRKDKKKFQTLK